MSYRFFEVLIVISLLIPGCKSTVNSEQGARDVELISQGYLHGDRKDICTEVDRFEVVVTDREVSGSKTQSTAELKARNEAARRGATHVLLWPETDQPCDDKGELSETGDNVCEVAPVTAYECVMGLSN